MALRWKKKPPLRGLMRISAEQRGSKLSDGEIEYASTGTYSRHDDRKGWYWVARNDEAGVAWKNTCNEPVADEATAKADALAYVRECLKRATPESANQGAGK